MGKHKVLLLGGDGYVGSRFKSTRQDIVSIDIGWYSDTSTPIDYNNLTKDYISNFSEVVLLAGHSSVMMCSGDYSSTYNEELKFSEDLMLNSTFNKIYKETVCRYY